MLQQAVAVAVAVQAGLQVTAALRAKRQAQETPRQQQVQVAADLTAWLVAVQVRRASFMSGLKYENLFCTN
jgi:hypothetical protein